MLSDRRIQDEADVRRVLQSAMDQAHEAMILTEYAPLDEPGPRIQWVSRGFEDMTGYAAEEVIGKTPRILHGPGTERAVLDRVRAALERGEPVNAQTTNYKADGTPFQLEWSITPVTDAGGRPTHWLSVQRDVTEREEALAQVRLLRDELSHRLKNIFAILTSLLAQLPRDGLTADEFAERLNERLQAMARAHDVVFGDGQKGAPMDELAHAVIDPLICEGRFTAQGPHVALPAHRAVSMALMLHELGTNAAKYGALSGPRGRVVLSWACENGCLTFEWRESGGPPVSPPGRRGFGSQLIEPLLRMGSREDAGLFFEEEGVVCRGGMMV
ncbi:PAS domain S-box protein [Parvularcula oceani]|uniref:PAS domain S-box protein n=1 Tax=Parvularcula oceani TaxID=1247963 RepID=UPI00068F8DF4|nr:PAS domain S-box protein [Parvularcula oceani]